MITSILIVEDHASIREMLHFALAPAGFQCTDATTAEQAWPIIQQNPPALILLDWMLPGMSGVRFCQRLKEDESTWQIPIILLTAKAEEEDKIQGLEAGADDYVTKPFSPRELIARIQAVLRRHTPRNATINAKGLQLDPLSQRLSCHGQPIELGPTEYRLLAFFMQHPERVYSRSQLLDLVWGAEVYVEERTVDVHILRLRKVLEPHGVAEFVQTVRGSGYRFSVKSK